MFQLFSNLSQGMFLVDRSGRIVWGQRGLPALPAGAGLRLGADQFVGHMVEEVIPNTQDAPRAGDRRAPT